MKRRTQALIGALVLFLMGIPFTSKAAASFFFFGDFGCGGCGGDSDGS